jgi:hypothetical protein
MRNILLFIILGILILSGLGAGALNNVNEKYGLKTFEYKTPVNKESVFTHHVLAEFGATSTNPQCPAVSDYLNEIYTSGDYEFYFVTLNTDRESLANSRYWELPAGGYWPTVWFDGGYSYLLGNQGSKSPYISKITQAGARSVADISLELYIEWLGDDEMVVTIRITNKEASIYSGHLHAYITEIASRWNDYYGDKFNYSMIGYAFNKNLNIVAGDTYSENVSWDGDDHGYNNLQEKNIFVIATVFDSGSKFVDETIGAAPGTLPNDPPLTPNIDGQSAGKVGTSYTYTFNSIDPNGDDVYYYVNWGDATVEIWNGPHTSGVDANIAHTYLKTGTYTIEAKAKDLKGAESDWAKLIVSMPKSKTIDMQFLKFLQNHPYVFSILRQLLKQ